LHSRVKARPIKWGICVAVIVVAFVRAWKENKTLFALSKSFIFLLNNTLLEGIINL
jgi:hypothetical protein